MANCCSIESCSRTYNPQHLHSGPKNKNKGYQWKSTQINPVFVFLLSSWLFGICLASMFERQVLTTFAAGEQPMHLAMLPDGRVLFCIRSGTIELFDPKTSLFSTAAVFSVTAANEDGLLGIVPDPSFAANNFIYVYWSPSAQRAPYLFNLLSRFTMSGNIVQMASRRDLLQVPVQRDQCCHSAGSLAFDSSGNLYLAVGDNTNPFASDGFAPLDERAGRSAWDSQRTAGNTNDLRGKILRIKPTYTSFQPYYIIPADNLFPPGTAKTKPEIYVMGLRNPFRIAVDPKTDVLYIGDVGPDANNDNVKRGPKGYDLLLAVPKNTPSNFGWPYCRANMQPYVAYNFATGASGSTFNCAAPINRSPNNNGLTTLPPVRSATIWYPYGPSSKFPEMNSAKGGRAACATHVYRTSSLLSNASYALPAAYEGVLIFAEWSRDFMRAIKFDPKSGQLLTIAPLWDDIIFKHPIAVDISPFDGSVYVLEFGTDFKGTGARLSRIRFLAVQAPVCSLSATPVTGSAPLAVTFSSQGTYDPNGFPLTYGWDFTSDGTIDSNIINPPAHTYATSGAYTAKLIVTDDRGNSAICTLKIIVGNNAPILKLVSPLASGVFSWGFSVFARVSVSDVEDGSTGSGGIQCSAVTMTPAIGHNDHSHDLIPEAGCDVTWMPVKEANIVGEFFAIIQAQYTDRGAPGTLPIPQTMSARFRSSYFEAEQYENQFGTQTEPTTDRNGGTLNVGWINNNDWLSYDNWNLLFIDSITMRLAYSGTTSPGFVDVRINSLTGRVIATAAIPGTGGWQSWTDVTVPIRDTNQWFEVDLAVVNPVKRLIMDAGTSSFDYPRGYLVYAASSLGTNGKPDYGYAKDYVALGNGTSQLVDIVFAFVIPARYIRIIQTGQSKAWWWSISELNVYDGDNKALNRLTWSFTASSTETHGNINNVKDGNLDTRWSTGELQRSGNVALYFVFHSDNSGGICNINYFKFNGRGISAPPTANSTNLPGRLEAESYSSAFDTTPGNAGGKTSCTRSDDVDIQGTSDIGGGCNVGWIESGEWLSFTTFFVTTGFYDVAMRVASASTGTKAVLIQVDGTNVTGNITFTPTGAWQTWTTVTTRTLTYITAGSHTVRLFFMASKFNINYLTWTIASVLVLPGRMEAEAFMAGPSGKANFDTTAGDSGNTSACTRNNEVDLQQTSDIGGGCNIGWIVGGEWLQYQVEFAQERKYILSIRVSAKNVGTYMMRVEVDGVDVTGSIAFGATGGWQKWTSITQSTNQVIVAGPHVVRVVMISSNWNLNYIDWI